MDDLAHELPLNHRKRKAPQDDHDDDKQNSTRPSRDNDAAVRPAKAPRLSWLSPDTSPALWNTPASPQVSTPITSPSALAAAFPLKCSQGVRETILHQQPSSPSSPTSLLSDPVIDRTDSEAEDMNPESVFCPSPQLPLDTPVVAPSISPTTLDVAGLHIPPMIPLINRQTLKDLDFNEIMHNTPLRASSRDLSPSFLAQRHRICAQDMIFCLTPAFNLDLRDIVGKRITWNATGMLCPVKLSRVVHVFRTMHPVGSISLQYAFAGMSLLQLTHPLLSPSLHLPSLSGLRLASAHCSTSSFKSFYM
jgi:hypothetical protein